VAAVVLAVLAPHALWRVQLKRQMPALGLNLNEPDDDRSSIPDLNPVSTRNPDPYTRATTQLGDQQHLV
jgi:hypothetical protein